MTAVLIVDSHLDCAEGLAQMLAQRGLLAEVFISPLQVVAAIGRLRPRVFVSELVLPDMDGFELARLVRAQSASSSSVSFHAFTAFCSPADRQRALDAGYEDVFIKPRDLEILVDTIVASAERGGLAG